MVPFFRGGPTSIRGGLPKLNCGTIAKFFDLLIYGGHLSSVALLVVEAHPSAALGGVGHFLLVDPAHCSTRGEGAHLAMQKSAVN